MRTPPNGMPPKYSSASTDAITAAMTRPIAIPVHTIGRTATSCMLRPPFRLHPAECKKTDAQHRERRDPPCVQIVRIDGRHDQPHAVESACREQQDRGGAQAKR